MIVYYGMYIIPLMYYFFNYRTSKKIINKKVIGVFFIYLLLVICLRNEKVGTDVLTYKYYFDIARNNPLSRIKSIGIEPLYYLLNYLVGKCTSNFNVFLAVCGILSIIPLKRLYEEEGENWALTIAIFMAVVPIHMYFSGIRQGIAISFAPIAYNCTRRKELKKFILVSILAILVHNSAFVILMMYPLYHMNLSAKKMIIIFPLSLFVYVFRNLIFSTILTNFGGRYAEKFGTEAISTGSFGMLLVFLMMLLYSYVIPSESMLDSKTKGFRNFLFLSALIQVFSTVSFVAMRLGYYYHIFIPLLIPRIVSRATVNKKIAKYSEPIMMIIFVLYFFIKAYSGVDYYNMFRYIPFWGR